MLANLLGISISNIRSFLEVEQEARICIYVCGLELKCGFEEASRG